jgi:hypothetical protein
MLLDAGYSSNIIVDGPSSAPPGLSSLPPQPEAAADGGPGDVYVVFPPGQPPPSPDLHIMSPFLLFPNWGLAWV